MVRVVVLSSDTRLTFQIESWFRDLAGGAKLEKVSSLDAFYEKYLPLAEDNLPEALKIKAALAAASGTPSPDAPKDTADDAAVPLRLVIADLDLIPAKPLQWIADTKKALREKYAGVAIPPRIMALSFEGGVLLPKSLCHEALDDLVLKPLDRSLFLQKVELLLADTPKVKPSFLFRQRTEFQIEAGKDVIIDEISEFALAIRNPAPLTEGMFAAIHCRIFGEGSDSRVVGRVYGNQKHPTFEGEYLVRFSFFGINSSQIAAVKKYVRNQQAPTRAKPSVSAAKKRLSVPAVHDIRIRVAVIDMNRDNFTEIKSALESNFKGVNVRVYPSYSRFLNDYVKLTGGAAASPSPSAAAPPSDKDKGKSRNKKDDADKKKPALPKKERLSFILVAGDHEFAHFDPLPPAGEPILGRKREEFAERKDLWLSLVVKEDREEFDEFLNYISSGAKGSTLCRMTHEDGSLVYLEASGEIYKAGDADGAALLKIDVKEISEERWCELSAAAHQVATKDVSALRFDAIFIDGGMLRSDPASWYEGMMEMIRKTGAQLASGVPPRIFIMASEQARIQPEAFKIKGVTDFFYKPADRKYLVQKLHALIPKIERLEEPELPPFIPCEIHAKLAKGVRMTEVAEYGLTIVHPTPIREKSYLRFFSRLFGDDPDGVIGHCTYSEKLESEKGGGGAAAGAPGQAKQPTFLCNFVFFGASEDLLRRIRTWIREDYVHKKDGSGGS